MMFRSQTDDQLAARWDAKPYVTNAGQRMSAKDRNRLPQPLAGNFTTLLPRVECIPSRDSRPWAAWPSEDSGLPAFRASSLEVIEAMPHREKFSILVEFDPRPEFARPPVNGALRSFRHMCVNANPAVSSQRHAIAFLDSLNAMYAAGLYPIEEIEHARKVLTRLSTLKNQEA